MSKKRQTDEQTNSGDSGRSTEPRFHTQYGTVGRVELRMLRWLGSAPWEFPRPAQMAEKWGISRARMTTVARNLKRKGLIVDAPPYALTKAAREVINLADDEEFYPDEQR